MPPSSSDSMSPDARKEKSTKNFSLLIFFYFWTAIYFSKSHIKRNNSMENLDVGCFRAFCVSSLNQGETSGSLVWHGRNSILTKFYVSTTMFFLFLFDSMVVCLLVDSSNARLIFQIDCTLYSYAHIIFFVLLLPFISVCFFFRILIFFCSVVYVWQQIHMTFYSTVI